MPRLVYFLTGPGIWTFDWTLQLKMDMYEALEKSVISEKHFPKVFAWVARLREAYEVATAKNGKAAILSDRDAIDRILAAEYFEPDGDIDDDDPLQLQKGQLVDISPVDSGFSNHDKGALCVLGLKEVAIEKEVPNAKGRVRVHFPRINFSIKPIKPVTDSEE